MNIIQFRSISVSFGSMFFFYFKEMLELLKIFLLVRFSNQISCNKGLKAKISCFFLFFLFHPRLECSRIRETALFLTSCRLKKFKNLHPWSFMNEQKCGKCWKSLLSEGKLQVFFSYLSEMKTVSMFYISSLL